ncbi:response regulator receiver signal transduction histidine kinase [Calothrix sp. NIES-3974]|nr:response regulator [Calothrix sp. NIES-3974]BAZ08169.1 response regulator receiver signal transduction histidine kinase [Calothrix sp. NIES-3974]
MISESSLNPVNLGEKISLVQVAVEAKPTILVIDDSPTNLEVICGTLMNAGYEVLVEMDGESGIQQAKDNHPDLILLDIMMPKIDGFETCSRLQSDADTKDIPIIFMTALTDTLEKVRGLKLGAVDYITKPFHQDEVVARIELQLKIRRLHLELEQEKQNLEQRVRERTAELMMALEELQKTQLQLVQNEKIFSLGEVFAGVAHEVNNPIGLISTNIYHANQYTHDLIHLVKTYRQKFNQSDPEIQELIENIDLDHIMEDLPKLISSMKLGSDRIHGIMQSVRNFSRHDGNKKKAVDIHEGIETTLMILQYRLKAQTNRPPIQVIKDYGSLPLVTCYSGQINQVFLNIITNAIDAIDAVEEKFAHRELANSPQIKITTGLDRENVIIKIADNGKGIPAEIQDKIFQPFFTTKRDKLTGVGLSISQEIITKNHQGQIFHTCTEKWTEFTLLLPLKLD